MRQAIVVEWAEQPEDWLWPIAVALEDAVEVCRPPAITTKLEGAEGPEEVFRLRVSVERHVSKRQLFQQKSFRSQHMSAVTFDDDVGQLHLVAQNSVLRCSTRPLLRTPVYPWAKLHGWLGTVMTNLMIAVPLFLVTWNPGGRTIRVADPAAPDVGTVSVRLRGVWVAFASILSMYWFYFLLGHTTCSDLFFRTLWSFEALMLCGCFTLAGAADVYELSVVASAFGDLHVTDIISHVGLLWLGGMPGVVLFSTFDSIMLTRRTKAIYCMCVLVFCVVNLYISAAFREWSTAPVCFWSVCMTPRHLFLSQWCTMTIFIAKMGWAYLSGHRFATLRTSYSELRQQSGIPLWRELLQCLCPCSRHTDENQAPGSEVEAPSDEKLDQSVCFSDASIPADRIAACGEPRVTGSPRPEAIFTNGPVASLSVESKPPQVHVQCHRSVVFL